MSTSPTRLDGEILGLKVKMIIDTGGYPGLGSGLPFMIEAMLPSAYKIGALEFQFTAVVTNKAPYVAYRGPWAAETFVRERIIDLVARDIGHRTTGGPPPQRGTGARTSRRP